MSAVASTTQVRLHAPQYRLTRRGRLVVFALALVAVAAVLLTFAGGSVATGEDGSDAVTTVVVQPGESLWTVASEASDGGDVRAMMQRIEDLNALSGTSLQSGQRLLVPAG